MSSADAQDMFDSFDNSPPKAPSQTRPGAKSPHRARGQSDEPRSVKASSASTAAASSNGGGSQRTSPNPAQSRALSAEGRAKQTMPGGPSSKDGKPRPPSAKGKEQGTMEAVNEDDLDKALSLVRENANEKSKPLILVLLHINQFYEEQMHVPSPHCSPIINGILWAMGNGRKINGDDATSHLAHLASKLGEEDSREVLMAAREYLLKQINDPKNAKVIAPFEQLGSSQTFKNTHKPKAQAVSASDLVDALMSKITSRGVKRFFLIKHKSTQAVADALYKQIAQTAQTFEKKIPGLAAECQYLISRRSETSLTEGNVETLFSAAMKSYGVAARIDNDGVIGTVGKPFFHYEIKKGNPFFTLLDGHKWQDPVSKEEKRFMKSQDGSILIPTGNRSRAIEALFPLLGEKEWTRATPESATIAIMCKAADDKKEVKEE